LFPDNCPKKLSSCQLTSERQISHKGPLSFVEKFFHYLVVIPPHSHFPFPCRILSPLVLVDFFQTCTPLITFGESLHSPFGRPDVILTDCLPKLVETIPALFFLFFFQFRLLDYPKHTWRGRYAGIFVFFFGLSPPSFSIWAHRKGWKPLSLALLNSFSELSIRATLWASSSPGAFFIFSFFFPLFCQGVRHVPFFDNIHLLSYLREDLPVFFFFFGFLRASYPILLLLGKKNPPPL